MQVRRILLDCTYTRLQPRAVGITRTVRRLAEELPAVARAQGADFVCVAFDGDGFRDAGALAPLAGDEARPAALRAATGPLKRVVENILRLPWPLVRPAWALASGVSFREAVASRKRIAFAPGDVLVLADASWNYAVDKGARQARRSGAAVVGVIYDLMPLQAPQFCLPWVRGAFADWLRRLVGGSDALLCDSRFTLESVREAARRHGWEMPPADSFRLGCDVPVASDGSVRDDLRAFLQHPRCYAVLGSFEPKKNHALVVAAFEDAWRRGCDARLLVIGRRTGECRDVVERLERHAREAARVMLVDDANDTEVAHAYRHCRALVVPSLYEGFGLPLVEARTAGCPVLASDLPVFREIADAGVRWFDPRDASQLAGLLIDDASGGAAAVPAMPAFSWRDSARQCVERIGALLPAPGGGVSLLGSSTP
ncbi:glycosyltransferase family 4 protein [Ramlibacter sp. PS4R-6]|uniref:glycosyltransferase family 4 protein n=1 Tax=Ramlibacter sp. PS4R-6 TaxID=3133438 RepID=UPI0030A8AE84